ncbi:MAG: helix-turn-helix transcriptional regulator [Thiothrix sp.]|nr:helix-turn-helix transcriptional regulator [Thiothrix sp.]HPQ95417.1 helix-turn-helix transcriptional regulator [Thiolinea sp.]
MNMMEIGRTLRQVRRQKQLTQQELGAMLGMSRSTVSGIENGTITEIGIRKVMALCAVLGLELAVSECVQRRPTLQTLMGEAERRKTGKGR